MICNKPLKILFIDVIGLRYDGTTLNKRGLGGSESAIILISQQLANLGFDVTVCNHCIDKTTNEGIYNQVKYVDLKNINQLNDTYDIVISSRTVLPFLPPHLNNYAQQLINTHETIGNIQFEKFWDIVTNTKHKVLWMHDTFCAGDEVLEDLVVNNYIDEIFVLSDWHSTYVLNCDHGRKRNFEVLKRKTFVTRNGIQKHKDEVDISLKDPNLFVYNASVTKGMIPLFENIWPKIKEKIPNAKLKIIGGFYKFSDDHPGDEQEMKFREMYEKNKTLNLDVEFTGIIKQSEIADILSEASYMLYPAAFPETFGISTLESLYYGTPLITNRFGALEETAIEQCSYMMDYAIEPNGLFPNIDKNYQIEKFVELTEQVYHNSYLHQQKQHMCKTVKDICGWDTVALQWKQHFYRVLNMYLDVNEYRKVKKVNDDVQNIFGRRFTNKEQHTYTQTNPQKHIAIITPMYRAKEYIFACIQSVIQQDYDNYTHYIIDDFSEDGTFEHTQQLIASLPEQFQNKFVLIKNETNVGALKNQVTTVQKLCNDNDIIVLLDGDDCLVNRNDVFHYINTLHNDIDFSYGSCWSMADNIPLIAQEYPKAIRESRSYRQYNFNWNIPYTHLRTFKKYLMNSIPESEFTNENGEWYKAGGDVALFYSLIERTKPNKIKAVTEILYNYNDLSPLNDYKINGDEQNKTAKEISNKLLNYIDSVYQKDMLPKEHVKYLESLNIKPKIVYDIGANVKHWARHAERLWNSDVYLFDANQNLKELYSKAGNHYHFGVLSDSNKFVKFYENEFNLAGNSYYKENTVHYNESHVKIVETATLNDVVYERNWPLPDMIKLDVQGAEIDVLKGASNVLSKCNDIILEAQIIDYNFGAPKEKEVIEFMNSIGYELKSKITNNDTDNDYHFVKATNMKKILLAIPTNKYIESETFKSIYDLKIPDGYEVEFQTFYGYQIDQIRNLIADWAKNYDYLFSVDSDIVLPKDSLEKMIHHNVDIVSGLYIQRIENTHTLEVYKDIANDGMTNIDINEIDFSNQLQEIAGCGFGCVLIKGEVFREMSYPHFVYKSALNHEDTVSEDTYFCMKARDHGFKVYMDTTIQCEHIGTKKFVV